MSGQPTPTQLRPALDLTAEYWQAHRLVLSRQRKNHAGEFVAAPLCVVYATAFDTALDATRALRLIQAAPELLRQLQTLAALMRAEDLETSTNPPDADAVESALCDAEALTNHLMGD